MSSSKERTPTLYAIIAYKLVKGALLLLLGVGVFRLKDKNLPEFFLQVLRWAHLNVESALVTTFIAKLRLITPRGFEWIATGSVINGSLHFIEGVALWRRKSWAAWLAIIQSLILVAVEIYELRRRFTWAMTSVLLINLVVVGYLFVNRHRLFDHHAGSAPQPHPDPDPATTPKKSPTRV
jgi:uncharacterized membrane protein (DUF2068 family)